MPHFINILSRLLLVLCTVFLSMLFIPSANSANIDKEDLLLLEDENTNSEQSANVEKESSNIYINLPWKGSLLFNEKELKLLYKMAPSWRNKFNGSLGGDGTQDIDENQGQSTAETATERSIALDSILYFNPESWSIWVNNELIRKDQVKDNIHVDEVNESYVVLIVQYPDFDINTTTSSISNNFVPYKNLTSLDEDDLIFSQDNDSIDSLTPNEKDELIESRKEIFASGRYTWKYKSKDNNILIDSKNGIFKFKIGIGQYFNINSLSIMEGTVVATEQKEDIGAILEDDNDPLDDLDF